MIKTIFVIAALLLNAPVISAQQATKVLPEHAQDTRSFEKFCESHALQRIPANPGKTDNLPIAGELTLTGTNQNYRDLGIVLKEEETQYFRIAGSTDILKVESLIRLRLAYQHTLQH